MHTQLEAQSDRTAARQGVTTDYHMVARCVWDVQFALLGVLDGETYGMNENEQADDFPHSPKKCE